MGFIIKQIHLSEHHTCNDDNLYSKNNIICLHLCVCVPIPSQVIFMLSRKLHSHSSSLPNCVNGDLVTWEAAHPCSCYGQGVSGEANSLSWLAVLKSLWNFGRSTCSLLVWPQKDLIAQDLSAWVVHMQSHACWAAMSVFYMAAIVLCIYLRILCVMCVYVNFVCLSMYCMCVYFYVCSCMHIDVCMNLSKLFAFYIIVVST